jgi:hypothetical protein
VVSQEPTQVAAELPRVSAAARSFVRLRSSGSPAAGSSQTSRALGGAHDQGVGRQQRGSKRNRKSPGEAPRANTRALVQGPAT